MRARATWLLVALGLLLAAACEDHGKPTEPVWNKQPCDHCHMLVSDPRYAAQVVTRSHERLFFDDPGCLAEYVNAHPDELEHAWVHAGDGWADASRARFSAGQASPMGYGFVPDPAGEHDFTAVTSAATQRRGQGAP